jgi:hypothetical protein
MRDFGGDPILLDSKSQHAESLSLLITLGYYVVSSLDEAEVRGGTKIEHRVCERTHEHEYKSTAH